MTSETQSQKGQIYTPAQIIQFFDYISLPKRFYPDNKPPLDVEFLRALHVHHIAKIPYENLSLHYNPGSPVDQKVILEPQFLFDKVVTKDSGRGGYCMEGSLLFLWMLTSLGFDAYATGVRIRYRKDGVPYGDYTGVYVLPVMNKIINQNIKHLTF
jgi:arylamine N-acetyltransferase